MTHVPGGTSERARSPRTRVALRKHPSSTRVQPRVGPSHIRGGLRGCPCSTRGTRPHASREVSIRRIAEGGESFVTRTANGMRARPRRRGCRDRSRHEECLTSCHSQTKAEADVNLKRVARRRQWPPSLIRSSSFYRGSPPQLQRAARIEPETPLPPPERKQREILIVVPRGAAIEAGLGIEG
jgi:hypothetical protein